MLNILKVKYIPWVDEELNPETSMIQEKLAAVNRRGVMTINSPHLYQQKIVTWSFINHKVLFSTKLISNENYDFVSFYHFKLYTNITKFFSVR
jgi:hypothetical protein